jgi:hypothetical protein
VTVAEFRRAVGEKLDERPVDVAEAEEAEVEGGDRVLVVQLIAEVPRGLKPILPSG